MMSGAIPGFVVLGVTKKQTEKVTRNKKISNAHPSMASVSVSASMFLPRLY